MSAAVAFPRADPAAKLLQAAECTLQELQPDSGDLQQACQLLDAKSPAEERSSQGSNADQQLQGTSTDGSHSSNESRSAADDLNMQLSKARSKAGSQRSRLKGKKQNWSDDATKTVEDEAKQQSAKAGNSAVKGSTVNDKKPKTVGADKGTSNGPPNSRYRLLWRQDPGCQQAQYSRSETAG